MPIFQAKTEKTSRKHQLPRIRERGRLSDQRLEES